MTGIHLDFTTLAVLVIALLAAPIGTLLSGWREKARAESAKLKAEAEAIKNPTLRVLATEAAGELPAALDLAAKAFTASRDHVVAEVSRVNPAAGNLVGTLIDTALTAPPPIGAPVAPPPAPVLGS
jgi:hypothetical protein